MTEVCTVCGAQYQSTRDCVYFCDSCKRLTRPTTKEEWNQKQRLKAISPDTRVKRYRKKPVIIEAIQLTPESGEECCKFIGIENILSTNIDSCTIEIKTLEGGIRASKNDYVIKGVNGEFYPCKPDIFHATYEGLVDKQFYKELEKARENTKTDA